MALALTLSQILFFQNLDDYRAVVMDDSFFTGYRKNILNSEEILVSILVPYTHEVNWKLVFVLLLWSNF